MGWSFFYQKFLQRKCCGSCNKTLSIPQCHTFLNILTVIIRELTFPKQSNSSLYLWRYLIEIFPARWIGRSESVEFPATSPDLGPLAFWEISYCLQKSVIYANELLLIVGLFHPKCLRMFEFTSKKFYLSMAAGGHNFEHQLKCKKKQQTNLEYNVCLYFPFVPLKKGIMILFLEN